MKWTVQSVKIGTRTSTLSLSWVPHRKMQRLAHTHSPVFRLDRWYSSDPMILIFMAALALLPVQMATGGQKTADTALRARIEQLFHAIITTDDDAQEAAARAEVISIYKEKGLPAVAQVGDEAAYEFVVLLASGKISSDLRAQILDKVKIADTGGELPADAAVYYKARMRIAEVEKAAEVRAPTNPALRDQIESMVKVDQTVRQQEGFDPKKMEATDRANTEALQAILDRYGVPTFATVGPQAADDFVLMILHQPPEFRRLVLEKVKAAVDAGQADPESYAKMYDRSQSDLGKKQLYGEQLVCNAGEKMNEAPIEDEPRVNQRRAELGLIRVEIYARIAAEMMPQFCRGS